MLSRRVIGARLVRVEQRRKTDGSGERVQDVTALIFDNGLRVVLSSHELEGEYAVTAEVVE